LPAWFGEFEHRDPSARPAHANHLAQATIGVGHIAQSEGNRNNLKFDPGRARL